jgi:hypothetical protein
MVTNFYISNPPKRKIPKGRVPRSHHYIMNFPTDLLFYPTMVKCYGFAYINFYDSFLEDCHKQMYKYISGELTELDKAVYTACLN